MNSEAKATPGSDESGQMKGGAGMGLGRTAFEGEQTLITVLLGPAGNYL